MEIGIRSMMLRVEVYFRSKVDIQHVCGLGNLIYSITYTYTHSHILNIG